MASSRFEDSNYAKKLFRLSSLFYGARRRLSFFLIRIDNDSRGGIQLLDYRMCALIDTVDNHEGPLLASLCFLLLLMMGSQYHTGSTRFMDLARFFEVLRPSLNARYVETVSTWVEGLLRDISKRFSPPNGGQNLKKTYSDLQRQSCALGALGLKVGGTLQQRAERIFLTKVRFMTKILKCSNFSFRTTIVRLSAFDVQASQLHQNLCRVRVELTIIVATRISPKFVGDGQKLKETDIAIGSGEIPVNPTPLLNETTTAAQTTLMKA
ncbi:unnamed protein product [Brassica oleracea]